MKQKKKNQNKCKNCCAAMIILLYGSFLLGCGRESIVVDKIQETEVDNSLSAERIVDNSTEGDALTEEETEATEEEIPAQETQKPGIILVMTGDILLHTPVAESGHSEDGSYCFDALFSNVEEEIRAADLALVNQEVIIGGTELGISGYPCFNAPYELGDALALAGFDVVLHATNHALDQGKKGVRNCLSFWEKYPDISVLGINGSREEQDMLYIYEQNGIRVAILNYTYGTNGIPLPSDMPYAVNLLEEEKVVSDLKRAEEQADFVVVCPHWGTEYQLTVTKEQQYWTDIFLENGVDLVLGTHPHVIEPIEWVRDGNGNEMLVYYSLGNFVNWTASEGEGIANRMVGGMAQVTIEKNEAGEAIIADYGVEPLVCHLTEGLNGVTTYLLSDYTDELAKENAIIAQDPAFDREYCVELCKKVWGDDVIVD